MLLVTRAIRKCDRNKAVTLVKSSRFRAGLKRMQSHWWRQFGHGVSQQRCANPPTYMRRMNIHLRDPTAFEVARQCHDAYHLAVGFGDSHCATGDKMIEGPCLYLILRMSRWRIGHEGQARKNEYFRDLRRVGGRGCAQIDVHCAWGQ